MGNMFLQCELVGVIWCHILITKNIMTTILIKVSNEIKLVDIGLRI